MQGFIDIESAVTIKDRLNIFLVIYIKKQFLVGINNTSHSQVDDNTGRFNLFDALEAK
jgi:hypothetical protein